MQSFFIFQSDLCTYLPIHSVGDALPCHALAGERDKADSVHDLVLGCPALEHPELDGTRPAHVDLFCAVLDVGRRVHAFDQLVVDGVRLLRRGLSNSTFAWFQT